MDITEQDISQLIKACGILDDDARRHIEALHDTYCKDLDRWCARRRRLADLRRSATVTGLAVAILMVCNVARAHEKDPVALRVTTTVDASDDQICNEIYNMLLD